MIGNFSPPRAGLRKPALLALALAASASAHSWVEYAYKIAPNGTFVGDVGFPRGYIPRNSTDPVWVDLIPQWLLPKSGHGEYTGQEILNEYPPLDHPDYPMLVAAAGDHIALMHNENGHTTLPFNQPFKPKNRGTIYFYGTSKAEKQERLFDVHLLWNRDGTGGNKRGKLLATRNYDDGICYQPNDGKLSKQRSDELAHYGAVSKTELLCQSDIKLPDDLEPGSIYTIYWYWDWPNLNPQFIDLNATVDGIYPWAGSFIRGDNNPHNFTMAALSTNESYSSVVDIKITGDKTASFAAKANVENAFIEDQDVYSKGIKAQMGSNFQVDVDAPGGGTVPPVSAVPVADPTPAPAPVPTPAPSVPGSQPVAPPAGGAGNPAVSVVTETVTVPPTTLVTTVYVTDMPGAAPPTTSAVAVPPTTALPVNPSPVEPPAENPASDSPSAVLPSAVAPTSVTPVLSSSAAGNPVPDVPVASDPVANNPVASSPVATNPVESNPVSNNPVSSNPVATNPVESNPIPSNPIPSNPIPDTPTPIISGSPVSDSPIPSGPVPDHPASSLSTETIIVTSTAYVPTSTHYANTTMTSTMALETSIATAPVVDSTIAYSTAVDTTAADTIATGTTAAPTIITGTTVVDTSAAHTTAAGTGDGAKLPASGAAPSVTPFMRRKRLNMAARRK